MSTRTTLRPQIVIKAGDMSDDIVSAATILQSISSVSYGVSWTGSTPIGTMSIEVSNDYSLTPTGTVDNAGTWTALVLQINGQPTTTIPITGNAGSGFIDVDNTAAYAVRLIYTAGSGTGTLSATINGKVS